MCAESSETDFDGFLKTKWTLGFKDRGLGRGDFAVVTPDQDLVIECPSKEVANHIIELHNKSLEKPATETWPIGIGEGRIA